MKQPTEEPTNEPETVYSLTYSDITALLELAHRSPKSQSEVLWLNDITNKIGGAYSNLSRKTQIAEERRAAIVASLQQKANGQEPGKNGGK
jgi:hypothetical protein